MNPQITQITQIENELARNQTRFIGFVICGICVICG